MSLVSEIETIVNNRIPGSTFVLASKFKANLNSYEDQAYTTDTPLVILDNELKERNKILQNANIGVQLDIILTFLSKDTINDNTDRYVNDNIIEPLKVHARGIYGAIYRLPIIRLKENEIAEFTLDPMFRRFNTVLSGVQGIARWGYNDVVNICPTV